MFLLNTEFGTDISFVFTLENIVPHFSSSCGSWGESAIELILSEDRWRIFLFSSLLKFMLCLQVSRPWLSYVFWKYIFFLIDKKVGWNMLSFIWIYFNLNCWGFLLKKSSWGFHILSFQPLFLRLLFQLIFSLLSYWNSNATNVSFFVIVPQTEVYFFSLSTFLPFPLYICFSVIFL